jgi:hypothetical protein
MDCRRTFDYTQHAGEDGSEPTVTLGVSAAYKARLGANAILRVPSSLHMASSMTFGIKIDP